MNTIFLKLLNMSAAGSVLILAVVLLRALLKRAPRWILCAMWALVAVRLLCPVSLPSPLSAFRAAPAILNESGEVELFRSAGEGAEPLLEVDLGLDEAPQAPAATPTDSAGVPNAAPAGCGVSVPLLTYLYLAGLAGMLLYLGRYIIKPFNEISELPAELAKGGLNRPLKENKHKYFGKFIWGLDMLRQSLEQAETRRLEQAKAEKTLLLSLSHDIKTPLAAIKLYSSALAKGLYTDKDKQRDTAVSINAKADEIEGYVGEIIKNSTDDFLSFNAEIRDFYLSEVINRLKNYYEEKLAVISVELAIDKYTDCLLSGDPDRLSEVLQNLVENAIKYGDGGYIKVSFDAEEDMRFITVTNSGCTLPESELTHIFDSFWRGSNTGRQPGSGLGLYICRRLMHLMNGDIFAEINGGDMCMTAVCKKA